MLKVSFSRIYNFSAAHRLHSDLLSPDQNVNIYDKCNNYNGHGHDYYLEVTIEGKPDPDTGMIFSMPEMDKYVHDVINELDHKHLDNEVDYFKNNISTAENIIQYLWQKLEIKFKNKLFHLKLWETNNNFFETGRDI